MKFSSFKASLVFEQDFEDKMLPFTFDLQQKELVYIKCKSDLPVLRDFLCRSILIGIDTETRPSFMKRTDFTTPNPTSIIQIAARHINEKEMTFIVDLLQLNESAENMKELDAILTVPFMNDKCLKIGQGLERDFRELNTSYKSMECFRHVNSVVEMTTFVKSLEPEINYLVSLKYLVKKYLNCNLVKTQQTSDWGQRPLTSQQIHYAACDALVLIRLYDAMLCEMEDCTCYLSGDDDSAATSEDREAEQQLRDAAKADKEPFNITSILSVIDTTKPVMSRKRKRFLKGTSCAEVDVSTELVSQYVKSWSSSAAKEWYASQLLAPKESPSARRYKKTIASKASGESEDRTDGSGELNDTCSEEAEEEQEEEEVHIPRPPGRGRHNYL